MQRNIASRPMCHAPARSLRSGVGKSAKRSIAAPSESRQASSRITGQRGAGCQRRVATAAAPTRDLPSDKFDYIIVGGGLAGCLLANRLSADPSKRVLLLEAGENNADPIVKIPAGITRLFKHPELDWNLQTVPQPTLGGRSSYLARGKLLGGSSSTNATLYHRGSAADYDGWGLDGWTSQDVLPWFRTAEDNPSKGRSQWHDVGGCMHVENPLYQNPLFETHFKASEQAGLSPNPDFNDWSRSQEGYGDFQVAITARGRRADAYRQFLEPIFERDNLTIVTRAQTTRVLIDGAQGSARTVGVEVQSIAPGPRVQAAGSRRSIRVADGGEVILCAGAVHTPQLLMLSGVGDAEHLREHGIEVKSDLPGVGSNLQDHPAVLSAFTLKDDAGRVSITDDIYDDSANVKPLQLLNWAVRGRGPLTSTSCDRGAFVRTRPGAAEPDLQLRYVAGCALNPDGVGSFVDFGRMKKDGKIQRWPSGITFQIIAVRPQSRGSVRLASSRAEDAPAIDLAYCSDAAGADRATLREGLRLSRKLAATDAWQPFLDDEMHPGKDVTSDDDLDAYIERTMHSANAVVGTCALGTVVSPTDFGVKGVSSLRVVDASVLPVIPGGQTGAPTVMVAERAASMLAQGTESVEGARVLAAA